MMRVWGFIPARGNSKNMTLIQGQPLIDYCIERALKAKGLERIYCSSDDETILSHALILGVGATLRPSSVSGPDTPIEDVVKNFLESATGSPQAICLIQPTSPFVRPKDIDISIKFLEKHKDVQSVQTICKVPHNFHAWNQRSFKSGPRHDVEFIFPELRATGYNKQHKPVLWRFGSLIVTRVDALLKGETFFTQPSCGFPIGWKEALDVDTEDDFELMRMILRGEER